MKPQSVSSAAGWKFRLCAASSILVSPAPQRLSFVWYTDSLDWKDYDADTIYNRVTSQVGPGSIVLFHNAALHTPEALPRILDKLINDGYTVVPISQLIYTGEYTIDHTGRQHAAAAAEKSGETPTS